MKRLVLNDITTENNTGLPMPLLYNKGRIDFLSMKCIDAGGDEEILNEGRICEAER